MCCAPAVSLWWRVGGTSRHSLLGLPSGKTGSMSCPQVPTTPALTPYPRSVQVGEFEVAIDGGIWVAIRVSALAQRRHDNGEHVQAEVQVLSKLSVPYGLLQV